MANKVETVMVPCGHRALCLNCSQNIRGVCPICRSKVTQVVKIYDV